MDPLTQGLMGAVAARAFAPRDLPKAGWMGLCAGMAPDLDVLIRSDTDPLMAVEYHRHFTHALVFIPLGALICALPWLLFPTFLKRWKQVLVATTAAVATHGLLDSATTYGTQLFWPFSNVRIAWDWISIIDPLFTLILLLGIALAALGRARTPAVLALFLAAGYLGLGAFQNQRALAAQELLAAERGHVIERGQAFPTLANLLVWRSLYAYQGILYSDRIRVGFNGEVLWTEGQQAVHVTVDDLPEPWRSNPLAREDFQRFAWFSDKWVAIPKDAVSFYGDARYSLRTEAFDPIWGIRFTPGGQRPTEWVSRTRERELNLRSLWAEIIGTHAFYEPLPSP
jgi:inner membrane protein